MNVFSFGQQPAMQEEPWTFAGGIHQNAHPNQQVGFSDMPKPGKGFNMAYEGNRGVTSAKFAGFNARLSGSTMGRALRQGTMESFGWTYNKGVSEGFLGLRAEFAGGGEGGLTDSLRRSGAKNSKFGGFKTLAKQAKMSGKGTAGIIGRTAMKSMGLGFTALFAIEGYRENGVMGAASAIGESIIGSTIVNYALAAAGGGVLAGAGLAVGAVAGGYALGEAGREHAKQLRGMEMGGGDQIMQSIESAGATTMRQRSLMALNNTHINGRMALGNEGFLMHRSFA